MFVTGAHVRLTPNPVVGQMLSTVDMFEDLKIESTLDMSPMTKKGKPSPWLNQTDPYLPKNFHGKSATLDGSLSSARTVFPEYRTCRKHIESSLLLRILRAPPLMLHSYKAIWIGHHFLKTHLNGTLCHCWDRYMCRTQIQSSRREIRCLKVVLIYWK